MFNADCPLCDYNLLESNRINRLIIFRQKNVFWKNADQMIVGSKYAGLGYIIAFL